MTANEKPFRPILLDRLARWVFNGLEHQDTVLGIPKQNFQEFLKAQFNFLASPFPALDQNMFCF